MLSTLKQQRLQELNSLQQQQAEYGRITLSAFRQTPDHLLPEEEFSKLTGISVGRLQRIREAKHIAFAKQTNDNWEQPRYLYWFLETTFESLYLRGYIRRAKYLQLNNILRTYDLFFEALCKGDYE